MHTLRAHLLVAVTSFAAPMAHQAQPAATSAQPLAASALRADLAVFRSEFFDRERSYDAVARVQAEQRLQRLEASIDTVSRTWFELEIARIVALADNGHTNVQAGSRASRYNRVPFRLVPLGGGFHVLRASGALTDLPGARLVSIDGRSIADVRAIAHTLHGGTPEWRDRVAPFVFESPHLLHALGVARDASAATYEFELPEGRRVRRRVEGHPPDAGAPRVGTGRWVYPEPGLPASEGWRGVLAPDRAPWSLREAGSPFRWRDAPELRAVVIELRQNFDAAGRPIAAFLAEMVAELERRKPEHVVLDMRMNGGGNLNTTRDFMRRLPSLVSGRIFALTSPWTFSAAISSVGYLEQAAPGRVTIVGEIIGDRLEFWAEGAPLTLANSGIGIGRARERHDYAGGCRAFTDCHRPVVLNPIAVSSLAPDIAAPWTIEAYRSGRDPAMEAVAAAIR
jgi:hypothetical protein